MEIRVDNSGSHGFVNCGTAWGIKWSEDGGKLLGLPRGNWDPLDVRLVVIVRSSLRTLVSWKVVRPFTSSLKERRRVDSEDVILSFPKVQADIDHKCGRYCRATICSRAFWSLGRRAVSERRIINVR